MYRVFNNIARSAVLVSYPANMGSVYFSFEKKHRKKSNDFIVRLKISNTSIIRICKLKKKHACIISSFLESFVFFEEGGGGGED